jgi:glycosyltransferase involved in cell wall biosynthesis
MIIVHLIVNVFNGEKYLEETLTSLVHQTYKNIVIHCFDNHSTDKTSGILKKNSSANPNVFIYKTPKHIPLVEARNYAVRTIGKDISDQFYFGFCDADDLWDKSWVESLIKVATDVPDILTCNGTTLLDGKTFRFSSCLSMSRPSPFVCPVAIQSCLFSSNIIQREASFFDENFKIIYDTEFWIRVGRELTYVHISNYLFSYRVHSESMAQTNFCPIISERWRILKKHNLSKIRFIFDFLRSSRRALLGKY